MGSGIRPWTWAWGAAIALRALSASAGEIDVNSAYCPAAPSWLKASRLERVVSRIEGKLEWDIRKIQLRFHPDPAEFRAAHGFGDSVLAYANKKENAVHVGPRVGDADFDRVFGHELVHVILFQKYKGAVPKWLEEGMANHLSKGAPGSPGWKVDYAWLSTQPRRDVTTMGHPFGATPAGSRYHYQASQALMEMIASRCPVMDLLQLSVGKKLESYLPTLCGISDIHAEFQAWLKRKAR